MQAHTAEDVDALVRSLYGDRALPDAAGVVHVTAVWEPPSGGPLVTLRIGRPATPESEHDFFVLNLSRAGADAIVTTGKMLRDEPHTRYDLQGAAASALAAWRRERAHRRDPPWLLVLTSGRDLPLDHPALHGAPRPIVYTTREAARALAKETHVEVHGVDRPSLRGAIDYLRRERGAARVTIEAGPSTTRALYEPPLAVDALVLSVYREPTLDPDVQGPSLLTMAELRAALPHATTPTEVREPSGRWTFQLLTVSKGTRPKETNTASQS